jgi:glycosyltransferase involved in cell wall biosynthesis
MAFHTTVVVPTFDRRVDVVPLVERLPRVLPSRSAEVLLVDDGTDGTPAEFRRVVVPASLLVPVLHREGA